MHGPEPTPPEAARVDVFDGVAAMACGDVLLVLWKTPARRARIERVAAWVDAALARHPDVVVCQFLLAGASPPDREGRVIARAAALRLAPRVRRAVMAPLGSSLWQAVVRAILRAAVRIAGHGERLKIATDERGALDAVAQAGTESSGSREQLAGAVAALYLALGVARPQREGR